MEEHDPRIFLFEPTGPSAQPNSIVINTQTMQPGEEKLVAEVLRAALEQRLAKAAAHRRSEEVRNAPMSGRR